MQRRALIIGFCALIFVGCSVWFVDKYFGIEAHAVSVRLWPAPTPEQVETQNLRRIAGWFSLNCGHVRRHENADGAISCATEALKTGKTFYVSFDFVWESRAFGLQRDPASGVIGLARNSSGALYEVATMDMRRFSIPSEPYRTVTVIRCEKTAQEQLSQAADRYLTCFAVPTE